MATPEDSRQFADTFERFLGPDATVWGSTKDTLRLAESEQRWSVRLLGIAVLIGVAVGYFSILAGLAAAGICLVAALGLFVSASATRITTNQRATIELQKEIIHELRKLNSDRGSN